MKVLSSELFSNERTWRDREWFFFWNNNKSIIQILFSLDWLLKFFPIAIVKSRFSPLLSNQPFGEILQSGTNCDSSTIQLEESCHSATKQRRFHRNQQFSCWFAECCQSNRPCLREFQRSSEVCHKEPQGKLSKVLFRFHEAIHAQWLNNEHLTFHGHFGMNIASIYWR